MALKYHASSPPPRAKLQLRSATATYEVHEIPTGLDVYENAVSWTPFRSVDHARSAGEMLARLHLAAQLYDAAPRKPRPLVASFTIFASQNAREALEQYLEARPLLNLHLPTYRDCEEALHLLDALP